MKKQIKTFTHAKKPIFVQEKSKFCTRSPKKSRKNSQKLAKNEFLYENTQMQSQMQMYLQGKGKGAPPPPQAQSGWTTSPATAMIRRGRGHNESQGMYGQDQRW